MNKEVLMYVTDDMKAGMIAQPEYRRGFPRFWRKHLVGIAPCESGNTPIGIVIEDAKKGQVIVMRMQGMISIPQPERKLTRWERLKRWAGSGE